MKNQFEEWPQKKFEVVRATVDVVAKQGLDKATTARIAKHAGVGEGTIYRHFNSKDELIVAAAGYTSEIIFAEPRENYDPELPVPSQYIRFCRDFLLSGNLLHEYHSFMEQFIDSPIGARHRKESMLALQTDPDFKPFIFPVNRILQDGLKQGVVKDLPMIILASLTLPPLTFILKNTEQGVLELNDEYIESIAQSCWAAVRR